MRRFVSEALGAMILNVLCWDSFWHATHVFGKLALFLYHHYDPFALEKDMSIYQTNDFM